MDTNNNEQKPVIQRNLTDKERAAISRMKGRGVVPKDPLFHAPERDGKRSLELDFDQRLEHSDAIELANAKIMDATGTANRSVGIDFLTLAGNAVLPAKADTQEMTNKMNSIAQTMSSLAPQDEFEGQLITQLVVLQEHSMNWLGRAMRTERADFANVYLNGASKLLTRHHETLEALMRYRRRGEQRVHVEHVHVHQGGQAIVGTVTSGVGVNQKSVEGPHAKV